MVRYRAERRMVERAGGVDGAAATAATATTGTTRAVSLAEASAEGRLRALIGEIAASGDGVIVEAEGGPAAAIVPVAEFEEFLAYRQGKRREEAAARLRALRQEVLARNRDLSPEEADALAERGVREVEAEMAREGRLVLRRGRPS